jgi:hypothetical protein
MEYRPATLAGLNPRVEHHGDETVRAVDITLAFTTVNTVLDELSPGLRESFYVKTKQQDLPGTELLTALRHPAVKSFKWEEKVKDVMFIVHAKAHDEPDLMFPDSKLSKLIAAVQEGGSVEIKFLAQVYATPEQVAQLYSLLDEGCKVSWRPMTEDEIEAQHEAQQSLLAEA